MLLTVLGEYVLPSDGDVWQETLVRSLEALGHKTQSARQALARSAGEWDRDCGERGVARDRFRVEKRLELESVQEGGHGAGAHFGVELAL